MIVVLLFPLAKALERAWPESAKHDRLGNSQGLHPAHLWGWLAWLFASEARWSLRLAEHTRLAPRKATLTSRKVGEEKPASQARYCGPRMWGTLAGVGKWRRPTFISSSTL